MKKNYISKIALAAALAVGVSLAGCGAPSSAETASSAEVSAASAALTEADLPAAPEYGANPDYPLWTTVPYEVEDAGITFTATVSANEDLSEFEILCNFFDDQKAVVTYDGTTVTIVSDRTGFMKDLAPGIIEAALAQDLWLPTSACSLEYVDPAANDNLPTYIQAGVWEDDFERANVNLNGLATDINDEGLAAYKQPCETKGTVVSLEYDTYYYAKDAMDGNIDSHATPVTKTAYVYLPAGYDQTKQYNVLYLLHGGGDTAETWFSQFDTETNALGEGAAVNILDNLFSNGDAEPCIVVTPGLYDVEGSEEIDATSNYVTDSFAKELRDLIPVVESTYSTYAEDVSEQGLIDSRDHRALAGLSMGSITTWHSGVAQCLDVVSWLGNMSGGPSSDVDEAVSYTNETVIPALEDAASQGYPIHMLLSFNGTMDMALEPHVATHHALLDWMENSDVLTAGENYDFVVSNGSHAWTAWNLYLYDMMKVFFK